MQQQSGLSQALRLLVPFQIEGQRLLCEEDGVVEALLAEITSDADLHKLYELMNRNGFALRARSPVFMHPVVRCVLAEGCSVLECASVVQYGRCLREAVD